MGSELFLDTGVQYIFNVEVSMYSCCFGFYYPLQEFLEEEELFFGLKNGKILFL